MTNKNIEQKKYDCFISHASEDKETFVRKLAETLSNRGLKVWYDEYELTIGDSLRESIDKGLRNSVCGLVILSKNFMNKNWTSHELNGLIARQNTNGQKIILPIWHNINREDVIGYSPSLADLYAETSNSDLEALSRAIEKKINKIKNYNLNIDADVSNVHDIHNDIIEKYEQSQKTEKNEKELIALLEAFILDKKHKIKLHSLLNSETEKLATILKSDFENLQNIQPDVDFIYSKMLIYDEYCERLLILLTHGLYWDDEDNKNDELWINVFKKILNTPVLTSGLAVIINIQLYPALLIYYLILYMSILKKRYSLLKNIINCRNYSQNNYDGDIALLLMNPTSIIHSDILNKKLGKNYYTPLSDHIHNQLKTYVESFINIETEYSDIFDLVEYFIHLQYGKYRINKDKRFWAPVGRFHWRGHRHYNGEYQLVAKSIFNENANETMFKNDLLGKTRTEYDNLISKSDEFLSKIIWR